MLRAEVRGQRRERTSRAGAEHAWAQQDARAQQDKRIGTSAAPFPCRGRPFRGGRSLSSRICRTRPAPAGATHREDLGRGRERDGALEHVGRLQVALQAIDEHHAELVLGREAEACAEVGHALLHEVVGGGQLDGLHVAEARVVAEHLDVEQANQELLEPLARQRVGAVGQQLLERHDFERHDAVLLLLRLGLADRLDEVEEVLRQVRAMAAECAGRRAAAAAAVACVGAAGY